MNCSSTLQAESRRGRPSRLGSRSALCACIVLLGSYAAAQVPGDALTLQAAMDRALAANPTIAAARLRAPIDIAGLALAKERLNPEATVEIEKETPKQAYGIAVPIELGGKRARRIAVGEATIRAGEAEVAATIAQVRNEVRRTYFGLLVAEARFTLLQETRDLAVRVRDAAQQRFDAGSAPRLEVMQAQLALATVENEATAAQGHVVAARAEFNGLLGQPLDTAVMLSSPIDLAPAVTRVAVLDLARRSNTGLQVLNRRIEAQQARLALAGALRVPDLVPTATLTHDAAPEFDYGWRAGLTVTLPLFTTHSAGVAVERTTLEQLTAERRALLAQIDAGVGAATALVDTHQQLYQRYRDDIVPQAEQVEQVAQDSYRLGQSGIAALLQALQATREVRLRSIDAVEQFQSALADLERAIGAPLP